MKKLPSARAAPLAHHHYPHHHPGGNYPITSHSHLIINSLMHTFSKNRDKHHIISHLPLRSRPRLTSEKTFRRGQDNPLPAESSKALGTDQETSSRTSAARFSRLGYLTCISTRCPPDNVMGIWYIEFLILFGGTVVLIMTDQKRASRYHCRGPLLWIKSIILPPSPWPHAFEFAQQQLATPRADWNWNFCQGLYWRYFLARSLAHRYPFPPSRPSRSGLTRAGMHGILRKLARYVPG